VLVGGIRVVQGVLLCQKRLKLSGRVDECKPLPGSSRLTLIMLAATVGKSSAKRAMAAAFISPFEQGRARLAVFLFSSHLWVQR